MPRRSVSACTGIILNPDTTSMDGGLVTMLAENAIDPYDYGRPLDVVVAEYIEANSPVAPELEGRITGLNLVR